MPVGQQLRFQGDRPGSSPVRLPRSVVRVRASVLTSPSSHRRFRGSEQLDSPDERTDRSLNTRTDMATLEVHDGQGRVQFVELERNQMILFGTSPALRDHPGRSGDQAGPRPDPLEVGPVQGRGFAGRRVRADQRPAGWSPGASTRATRSPSAPAGSSCSGWTRGAGRRPRRAEAEGPDEGQTRVMPPPVRPGHVDGPAMHGDE